MPEADPQLWADLGTHLDKADRLLADALDAMGAGSKGDGNQLAAARERAWLLLARSEDAARALGLGERVQRPIVVAQGEQRTVETTPDPPDPGRACPTCGVMQPSGACSECGHPLPLGSRADRVTCSPACRTRRRRRLAAEVD